MYDKRQTKEKIMESFDRVLAENERLRSALIELKTLGEQGMKPDYKEWLTFHDKVAAIANAALTQ